MTELFVPEYPPILESDEGRKMAEYVHRQFTTIRDEFDAQPGMVWRGFWEEGRYNANDLVVDNGWLAIALRSTVAPPEPHPVGNVRNIINVPGAPVFSSNSVSSGSLVVGTRYEFAENIYIRDARFYVPASAAGIRVDAWIILDPDTDPSFKVLVSAHVIDSTDTGKWISVPVGLTFIQDSRKFDLIAAFTSVSGEVTFSYEWNYIRSNQNPNPGEIRHKGGSNSDTMLVHEQDESSTDRSADLDNIVPGSDIEMQSNGYNWRVLSASKSGSIYTFKIQPSLRAPAGNSFFEFSYYGVITINYVETLNHYSTLPSVSGFQSTTGYSPIDSPVTLTQNAYGIDIQTQGVLVSDDWQFLAYSG